MLKQVDMQFSQVWVERNFTNAFILELLAIHHFLDDFK